FRQAEGIAGGRRPAAGQSSKAEAPHRQVAIALVKGLVAGRLAGSRAGADQYRRAGLILAARHLDAPAGVRRGEDGLEVIVRGLISSARRDAREAKRKGDRRHDRAKSEYRAPDVLRSTSNGLGRLQ